MFTYISCALCVSVRRRMEPQGDTETAPRHTSHMMVFSLYVITLKNSVEWLLPEQTKGWHKTHTHTHTQIVCHVNYFDYKVIWKYTHLECAESFESDFDTLLEAMDDVLYVLCSDFLWHTLRSEDIYATTYASICDGDFETLVGVVENYRWLRAKGRWR